MVRLRPLSKPATTASPAPPPTAAATMRQPPLQHAPPTVDCNPSFAVDLVADMPSPVLGISLLVPCAQAPALLATPRRCLLSYRKRCMRRLHARLVLATTIGLSGLQLLQPLVASGGPAEVPLPAGNALPALSLLRATSLGSDKNDDDEELTPRSPLDATKGVVSGLVRDAADVRHDEEVLVKLCGLSLAVDSVGDDEGWVHVGRGGHPSREPSSLLQRDGLERSLAFKRWAQGRCFRCLERDHQVSTCREPFRCIHCRRPGHRERFCYARFPAARSRSSDARRRPHSPDARDPTQRSRSPSAQPRRPSASQSWAEVVCPSSSPATSSPKHSPRCCEEFNDNASFDSRLQCQFSLLRMELSQLVANRVEEALRPLLEEVESLKLLLAHGGVSLEPIEACSSGGLDLATAQVLFPLGSAETKSSLVEEQHLYSCFSPRGSPCQSSRPIVLAVSEGERIDEILAPVLQITPELHEIGGDSSLVPELLELRDDVVMCCSIEEVRSDLHGISVVASPSNQALGFEKICVVDVAVSSSSVSSRRLVPIADGVVKSGLLANEPGVVVAREFHLGFASGTGDAEAVVFAVSGEGPGVGCSSGCRAPPGYLPRALLPARPRLPFPIFSASPVVTLLLLWRYGIAAIAPFSHRLAFDDLPADIQRLRCKVNFEALVFLPYIISLGRTLEKRLRSPVQGHSTELAQQRVEENTNQAGKYAVLHLRFDKDMAAHSACDFGGGRAEKLALAKYRQVIWQGRVLNSQLTDEELRNTGRCPLTPEEIGLILVALGFDNSTRLYLASHKVYGGEARISSLRKLFPLMEDKRSLASEDELTKVEGKASVLAALDYYISMHSDVFISASPGNMHNALLAHRTYRNLKTIRPNMALLGHVFVNKSMEWSGFQQAVQAGHKGRYGQIRLRKPTQSIYTYPAPDCMCQG
ncbi:hypothetical protein QYE76_018397 [Lolium multiflorum]|uniref:O-fucosyltransferase family protein n=1 Tax=Lolium multiflorum TaxID=4521 RepID=A0AAD8QFI1_LOLMU|nr:hypothetical protein QYE76_018397 [Lolium multiflorum]